MTRLQRKEQDVDSAALDLLNVLPLDLLSAHLNYLL